jgi:flavin reductase (DIM6/NTAB) family NADH-FMN oxidoreductase RutF
MPTHNADNADAYKALARRWIATVNVVTALKDPAKTVADGENSSASPEIDGFTATAFLTVSINPPIILVSATSNSSAATVLRQSQAFAVNLLRPEQVELAGSFAKPQAERASLWQTLPWTADAAGVPILAATAGAFSATVREIVDAGDHVLVLGDVTAIHIDDGAEETLVYHNRAYGTVQKF